MAEVDVLGDVDQLEGDVDAGTRGAQQDNTLAGKVLRPTVIVAVQHPPAELAQPWDVRQIWIEVVPANFIAV